MARMKHRLRDVTRLGSVGIGRSVGISGCARTLVQNSTPARMHGHSFTSTRYTPTVTRRGGLWWDCSGGGSGRNKSEPVTRNRGKLTFVRLGRSRRSDGRFRVGLRPILTLSHSEVDASHEPHDRLQAVVKVLTVTIFWRQMGFAL